jgi:porphobilinogen synthase
MMQETFLRADDLVVPIFVCHGNRKKEELTSLPGVYKYSSDEALKEVESLHKMGIPAVALFPINPKEAKDESGSLSLDKNGLIPSTLKLLKNEIPSICLIADVALDPYTSHGHDGIVNETLEILNDETVDILCKASALYAENGADYVAPSDMMDGRVEKIRRHLDKNQFQQTGIISYTAKYASSFYGPFRDTLGSTLKFGDKKTYQMNPANIREALLEAKLDEDEGADALLVKPAGLYLDVIQKLKENTNLPICAYQVSGEYAMIKAAEEKGILDAKRAFLESLLSIKRAGADFIFTYAAPQILHML